MTEGSHQVNSFISNRLSWLAPCEPMVLTGPFSGKLRLVCSEVNKKQDPGPTGSQGISKPGPIRFCRHHCQGSYKSLFWILESQQVTLVPLLCAKQLLLNMLSVPRPCHVLELSFPIQLCSDQSPPILKGPPSFPLSLPLSSETHKPTIRELVFSG